MTLDLDWDTDRRGFGSFEIFFLAIFLPNRGYTEKEDYGRLGSKASVLPSRITAVSH